LSKKRSSPIIKSVGPHLVDLEVNPMHMILCYPNGRRVDALLLTIGSESMRAAVRERNETLEFQRIGDHWLTEGGERVSIDAMFAIDTAATPRARAASGQVV
jgi:hypothetical protein